MRIICFFILITTNVFCQKYTDSKSLLLMKEIVHVLANDSMQGRAVGTVYEQKSLDYISTQFKLLTKRKMKIQTFDFELDSSTINSKNGYAFINNHRKETIIIGAHYDHIGMGGTLSMSRKSDEVHNGADDNASGVALLMALSQKLNHQQKSKYNYLIVFYSAHEVGLFGSSSFKDFVAKRKRKFKQVKMVINFDMVGRMHPQLMKLKCMASQELAPFLNSETAIRNGFSLNIADVEKLEFLDTKSFYTASIPCVNFTTGIHNDYHAVSDDVQYINFEGMDKILNFVLGFVYELK